MGLLWDVCRAELPLQARLARTHLALIALSHAPFALADQAISVGDTTVVLCQRFCLVTGLTLLCIKDVLNMAW